MDILVLICMIALFLLFTSYNHILATRALRRGDDALRDSGKVSDAGSPPQEMHVRAVKAYTLGEYIIITTVIQRGSSKRSIGEIVIDEPSLLIPLTSLPEDSSKYEGEGVSN